MRSLLFISPTTLTIKDVIFILNVFDTHTLNIKLKLVM